MQTGSERFSQEKLSDSHVHVHTRIKTIGSPRLQFLILSTGQLTAHLPAWIKKIDYRKAERESQCMLLKQ